MTGKARAAHRELLRTEAGQIAAETGEPAALVLDQLIADNPHILETDGQAERASLGPAPRRRGIPLDAYRC